MTLKWTRTPPTEAGWYWMRDGKGEACPVQVTLRDGRASARGGIFSIEISVMRGFEWSERPIQPPEEAS